jgi:hypothetical protein
VCASCVANSRDFNLHDEMHSVMFTSFNITYYWIYGKYSLRSVAFHAILHCRSRSSVGVIYLAGQTGTGQHATMNLSNLAAVRNAARAADDIVLWFESVA